MAGVKSDSAIATQFAEQAQEVAFPATDFNDSLAIEVVRLEETLSQRSGVVLEDAGEVQCVVVRLRVVGESRIERRVGNESAVGAERKSNVAFGAVDGFVAGAPEGADRNWLAQQTEKNREIF